MKRLIPILLCIFWACSGPEPMQRPEPEPDPELPHGIWFDAGNPATAYLEGDSAPLRLLICRENGASAPAQAVAVSDGSVIRAAQFEEGAAQAVFTCKIDRTTTFSLLNCALSENGPATWTVEALRPGNADELFHGTYLRDENAIAVDVRRRKTSTGFHYSASAPGFETAFTTAGSDLRLDGDITYYDVRARAYESEGLFCLVRDRYSVEYLIVHELSGWSAPELWTFSDGWLTPVIEIEGKPAPDPDDVAWSVWLQRKADRGRILDLYRGASFLSPFNTAPAGSLVYFTIADGEVDFPRQFSGFTCPDIFPYTFEIAGKGTATEDLITIPTPEHTTSTGALEPWARLHPSTLTRKQYPHNRTPAPQSPCARVR